MRFELTDLRGSTVWSLYRMRDRIQLDPHYQRLSDIWTLDKRQLLLDTILNDFDIPKLYLHKFDTPLRKQGRTYDYAIIDGKQRLETMWAFIDCKIALAPDFEFFGDPQMHANDMTYTELGQAHPDLKVQFDSFHFNVVVLETKELEMIEEMFSRLNEAAPLTAPEKRNAYGGPLPRAIRKLAKNSFFKTCLPFPNKRFRHLDMATKFLFAERAGKVVDTKKVYLDKFVEEFASQPRNKKPPFLKRTEETVSKMATVFTEKDPLLRQVGMVMLYYHLFRIVKEKGWTVAITRKRLADFEALRDGNNVKAEDNITQADYDLLEFDRYAQSPNDAYAIRFRLRLLFQYAFKKYLDTDSL